jgi:enoyl-CoA hydratase/carnithine racemase
MPDKFRYGEVAMEVDGPIARIILNRPDRLNALSVEMQQGIVDAADRCTVHRSIRAVILRGAGGTFTAGADLELLAEVHAGEASPTVADLGRRMADAVEAIPAVTIAAIEGHCVGGGVVLAAACDMRVASEDTFFSIPEVDLGIPLAWGGTPRLVRELGPARTLELIVTCREFGASEAMAFGLLNRVVPKSQLGAIVDALAAVVAAKPANVVRTVKAAVRAAADEMVRGLGRTEDAQLLLGVAGDDEAAAMAFDYLKRFRSKSNDGD